MARWFVVFANGRRLGRVFTTEVELRTAFPRIAIDRDIATLLVRP